MTYSIEDMLAPIKKILALKENDIAGLNDNMLQDYHKYLESLRENILIRKQDNYIYTQFMNDFKLNQDQMNILSNQANNIQIEIKSRLIGEANIMYSGTILFIIDDLNDYIKEKRREEIAEITKHINKITITKPSTSLTREQTYKTPNSRKRPASQSPSRSF